MLTGCSAKCRSPQQRGGTHLPEASSQDVLVHQGHAQPVHRQRAKHGHGMATVDPDRKRLRMAKQTHPPTLPSGRPVLRIRVLSQMASSTMAPVAIWV